MAEKNMHPQAQLNPLELAIAQNALAMKRAISPEPVGGEVGHLSLLSSAVLVGSRYQTQGTAEGAETIAAAIDRLARAVVPPLERMAALHADKSPNKQQANSAWADGPGHLCKGNSRLVFAASCAFAGPLLSWSGIEGGGFHLYGPSASGKSAALAVASSVSGFAPSTWSATDSALESVAMQHCDSLLVLDELERVGGKVAGEGAYMLANGKGKTRATRNRLESESTWRLLFLSSGETALPAVDGDRVINICADAGVGLGVFENLHGEKDGGTFAELLVNSLECRCGAVGLAFREWALASRPGALGGRVREAVALLADSMLSNFWLPEGASEQVSLVAQRFALVGVAGMLATEAGLTGWDEDESPNAARACFGAWLADSLNTD